MVDSKNCLDRFVLEGISQVSRGSEVGNTKRRSLNTQVSSGTSAETFAVSAGPYRNYHVKAGTKNEPCHVFGTISKKGMENRSSRFELVAFFLKGFRSTLEVGLGILQITSAKRCPQVWPWFGRYLFVEFDQAV